MIPIQLERRANGVANEDLNVGSIVTALTIVNRPLWQRGRCLQEWAPAGEDGCNQRMIRLWSPPLRSPISTAWPSARHKESNFAASICFMTAPFAWPLFNSCIQVTLRATSPLSLCSYNSYWAAFCFKLLIGHLTHRLTSNLSILGDLYWNACSNCRLVKWATWTLNLHFFFNWVNFTLIFSTAESPTLGVLDGASVTNI